MFRQLILAGLFFLLPGIGLAEGSHGDHPAPDTTVVENPPQDEKGVVLIDILGFKYLPAHFKVKAGTTVRWVNKEKRQYHNVWFEKLGDPEPPYLFPGDKYERTFDTPGTFPYRCGPHPEMTGSVVAE